MLIKAMAFFLERMKSIVFDVDGCIVKDTDGYYSIPKSKLLKALGDAENRGVLVHLNSARSIKSLKRIYNDLGLKGVMIVENGAYSYNPVTGELRHNSYEHFDLSKLLKILEPLNEQLTGIDLDDLFMRPKKIIDNYSGEQWFFGRNKKYSQVICPRRVGRTIENSGECLALIKNEVKGHFPNFEIKTYSDICAVEIRPKNLSKANFMDVLERPLASFGDNPPDVRMFEVSDYCGCPANAKPEVKESVENFGGYVCEKSVTEGVIEFINHVLSLNSIS